MYESKTYIHFVSPFAVIKPKCREKRNNRGYFALNCSLFYHLKCMSPKKKKKKILDCVLKCDNNYYKQAELAIFKGFSFWKCSFTWKHSFQEVKNAKYKLCSQLVCGDHKKNPSRGKTIVNAINKMQVYLVGITELTDLYI